MTVETTNAGMWVIGYGSLIFKPPPHYSVKVSGYLEGYIRRFWQSSTDHRGTKQSPGRVATLVSLEDLRRENKFHGDLHLYEFNEDDSASSGAIRDVALRVEEMKEEDLKVWGVAYYIDPENVAKVKEYLDIREKNGYSTHDVPFYVVNTHGTHPVLNELPKKNGQIYIESMIYIGTIDNEAFVGPETMEETAAVIRTSVGPSGPNIEYLVELTRAVSDLDPMSRSTDYYLEDLVQLAKK
jgi:cation transport protein ChaC